MLHLIQQQSLWNSTCIILVDRIVSSLSTQFIRAVVELLFLFITSSHFCGCCFPVKFTESLSHFQQNFENENFIEYIFSTTYWSLKVMNPGKIRSFCLCHPWTFVPVWGYFLSVSIASNKPLAPHVYLISSNRQRRKLLDTVTLNLIRSMCVLNRK